MCLFRKKNTQPCHIEISKEDAEILLAKGLIVEENNTHQYTATGSRSVAFGVQNEIRPSGICTDAHIIPQEELIKDPLNPIDKCIFCKGGKCYYGGDCDRRKPFEEEIK